MALDTQAVMKIAKLARVRMDAAEVEQYKGELNKILALVEELGQVNTDHVQPMTGVGNFTQRLRDDVVTDGNRQQAVLKNAPKSDFDCFTVPKVVE